MSHSLAGRVAVVTGAGSGVGRATARALAARGAEVGLLGRTERSLLQTAELIREGGGLAIGAPADVADERAVRDAISKVIEACGGVDILVCAAGVGLYGPVESYSFVDWQTTMATNLTGVFLPCRAVIPSMKARGGGAIIAIGSGAGKQGYADLAAYSASKFGLIGFLESLAVEVRDDQIKVSTINPGSILTGFGGRSLEEKERQRAEGRAYLAPEDVAASVLYLLEQPAHAWTQELNLWPR